MTRFLFTAPASNPEEQSRIDGKIAMKRDYITSTAKTMKMEFKQILKIDNLRPLSSLTRLYLDNNFIERITGLDSLVHLVWLDLSFNRIIRIEGLENVKKLQVLALYQNKASSISHEW